MGPPNGRAREVGERCDFGAAPLQDGGREDGGPGAGAKKWIRLPAFLLTRAWILSWVPCPLGKASLPSRAQYREKGAVWPWSSGRSIIQHLRMKMGSCCFPGPHFCSPPNLLLPSFQFLTTCLYHSSNQTSSGRGQVLPPHQPQPPQLQVWDPPP